jgi:uncharacterized membrane protein required for colicin V production
LSLAIDIILVLILALAAWRGFRNGFIRGVLGLVAIVVAIYGANLVAKTYSGEFTGMLKPFVGGIIDSAVSDAIVKYDQQSPDTETGADGDGESDADTGADGDADTGRDDDANVFEISFEALRNIGISSKAAGLLAEKVGDEIKSIGQQMTSSLTEKLCGALAYIILFGISFVIILIIFAIIGNLMNLVYILPGIETADRLIGLILGLVKGALIVFAIAVMIRYLGLLSPEAVQNTTLLKLITDVNPLADLLGI